MNAIIFETAGRGWQIWTHEMCGYRATEHEAVEQVKEWGYRLLFVERL
jgi:hypothetical protein